MDWLRYPRNSSHEDDQAIGTNNRLFVINEGERQADMSTPLPGQAMTVDSAVHTSPNSNGIRKPSDESWSTEKMVADGASVETLALPLKYARYNAGGTIPPQVDSEKAERLYQNHRIAQRGGWGRLVMLLIILACVAIALGVGLGVGLTQRKKSDKPVATTYSPASPSSTAVLGFPIGEYSLATALYSAQTNCTFNSATWRCPPYTTYASSASASLTTFDWILSNTSASYITNASLPTTTDSGIAANLTISSSSNPFSLSFTNQTLKYYNDNDQPRFQFSLTMSQQTVPSSAITADNSASLCFYNDTILTGTLWLTDALTVDLPANSSSTSYQAWPYAVDVEQVAAGGVDVPACYTYTDGVVGTQITTGFTAEPSTDECVCDYRNYEL